MPYSQAVARLTLFFEAKIKTKQNKTKDDKLTCGTARRCSPARPRKCSAPVRPPPRPGVVAAAAAAAAAAVAVAVAARRLQAAGAAVVVGRSRPRRMGRSHPPLVVVGVGVVAVPRSLARPRIAALAGKGLCGMVRGVGNVVGFVCV
jgi:hypothetical protein